MFLTNSHSPICSEYKVCITNRTLAYFVRVAG